MHVGKVAVLHQGHEQPGMFIGMLDKLPWYVVHVGEERIEREFLARTYGFIYTIFYRMLEDLKCLRMVNLGAGCQVSYLLGSFKMMPMPTAQH